MDPNKETVVLALSPLDAIMGHLGLTIIYVFPPPPPSAAPYDLERVHAALLSTIQEDYPIFVGQLFQDPVIGSFRIMASATCAKDPVRFFVDREGALTTEQAITQAPISFLPPRERETELLTVKATALADGGLVLGLNSNHALLDGEGTFTFVKVWGMHYHGVRKQDRPVICHDRHLVAPRGTGFKLPHPEFIQPQAVQPETPADVAAKTAQAATPPPALAFPKTTQRSFHFTPSQLKTLKARVVAEGMPEGDYVSTIDVVTALFTVWISQARGHQQAVKITTGVNGRTRFNPPLPSNFAGNCIFNALSTYTAEEMAQVPVTPAMLNSIARRIRQSILMRDERFMRDAIEFIAQDGAKWVNMRAGVEFFFGNDLMFTSWANMGMYDADFGGGRPWYTGPPRLPVCDGMVVVMEAMRGGEGLDVLPLLDCEVMDKLVHLYETCELLRA